MVEWVRQAPLITGCVFESHFGHIWSRLSVKATSRWGRPSPTVGPALSIVGGKQKKEFSTKTTQTLFPKAVALQYLLILRGATKIHFFRQNFSKMLKNGISLEKIYNQKNRFGADFNKYSLSGVSAQFKKLK